MTDFLSIPLHALRVSADELLRTLGCPISAQTDDMRLAAKNAIDHACSIAIPHARAQLFSIEWGNGSPSLAGTTLTLPGRDIANHLQTSNRCLLMAVTLGIQIERELIRLSHNPAQAVYFDAACSLLIEAAADAAEAVWLGEIEHTETVYRYSPGYGDLPLSIQPQMLSLLDAHRTLGLTLTDSGLMIPRKSISALVGIR